MREDHSTIDKELISKLDILSKDCHVLHMIPCTNTRTPSNDTVNNVCTLLHTGTCHNCAVLNTCCLTNGATRSNNSVGTQNSTLGNGGCGVNKNRADHSPTLGFSALLDRSSIVYIALREDGEKKTEAELLIERIREIRQRIPDHDVSEDEREFNLAAEEFYEAWQSRRRRPGGRR